MWDQRGVERMNAEPADLDEEAPPVVSFVRLVVFVRILSCQFDTRNFRDNFSQSSPRPQKSQPEAGLAVTRGDAPPGF
jgi:hypothetical protein